SAAAWRGARAPIARAPPRDARAAAAPAWRRRLPRSRPPPLRTVSAARAGVEAARPADSETYEAPFKRRLESARSGHDPFVAAPATRRRVKSLFSADANLRRDPPALL